MSPQLSSRVADMVEEIDENEISDIETQLHIVEPRKVKSYTLSPQSHFDEVVVIGGRFTVSF